MSQTKPSLLPGIILIIFGLLLLVHKLDIFYFDWHRTYPLVFMLIGVVLFISTVLYKHQSAAFWGTVFLLAGLFFFLRNYDFIEYYYIGEIWPVFFIILGLAFVVLFLFKPQDWGVLIPGGIFLFLGTTFFLRNFHYWRAQEIIARYWPLVLILIGIGVIVGGLKKKPE
jgi:membrane-bound ClpP family serine protease